jgi:hypothetical protein
MFTTKGNKLMRIRQTLIATALLIFSTPLLADNTISPRLLDDTLEQAQTAVAERDYDTAFNRYSLAAQWGDKSAQFVLGQLYLMGKGTDVNTITGYAWLLTAAEAPVREFRKELKSVRKTLSDTEIKKASKLAEDLIAQHGMKAAGVLCEKDARTGTHIRIVTCQHRQFTPAGRMVVANASAELQPAS